MTSWCTVDAVNALVSGSPSSGLVQKYADEATSLLFELSGRCFAGQFDVQTSHQVDRNGHIKLNDWQPVNSVADFTIDDTTVAFTLSPAGTYITVDSMYRSMTATFTLSIGQDPPASGITAAAFLAAEMLRGDPIYAKTTGATDARPSFRVTSISRQGVTYTFADPNTMTKEGLTGVYEVDLFLSAVNPGRARTQPKVVTV